MSIKLSNTKHKKQYAQRGGGCSSYHAAIQVVVALGALGGVAAVRGVSGGVGGLLQPVVSIIPTSAQFEAAKETLTTLSNNAKFNDSAYYEKYMNDNFIKPATNAAKAYNAVAKLAPDASGTPSTYIIQISTRIENINVFINKILQLITSTYKEVLEQIEIIKTVTYDPAKLQVVLDLFILLRKKLANLCKYIALSIVRVGDQVKFLYQVAHIYDASCNTTLQTNVPTLTDINLKWLSDHMKTNADADYTNMIVTTTLGGKTKDAMIKDYKDALRMAEAPFNNMNSIVVNYCDIVIGCLRLVNNTNMDKNIVLMYLKLDKTLIDPENINSFDGNIKLIQDVTTVLMGILNTKLAIFRATGGHAASVELQALLNTLQSKNDILYVAVNKLQVMVGGARRHKKLLSLKRNKLQSRNKQNNNSRTKHNTQKRKKHNKQK